MKVIYPMVGASAAACAQNLKSSSFTGTFSGGWTYASTGITPNGTSGYMNTNLIPNTQLQQDSIHISGYIRNNITSGAVMGCSDDTGNGLNMYPRFSGNSVFIRMNSIANSITTSTDSRAFHIGNRISSTAISYYKNNSKSTLSNNSTGLSLRNLILGASNESTIGNYSAFENAFSSIGDGLTDTEASDFYTVVQAFQTTLSRQV